jgi:hypothetical protein
VNIYILYSSVIDKHTATMQMSMHYYIDININIYILLYIYITFCHDDCWTFFDNKYVVWQTTSFQQWNLQQKLKHHSARRQMHRNRASYLTARYAEMAMWIDVNGKPSPILPYICINGLHKPWFFHHMGGLWMFIYVYSIAALPSHYDIQQLQHAILGWSKFPYQRRMLAKIQLYNVDH